MSHYYATIPTSARRTTATARGHKNTGIGVTAASWDGGIAVDIRYNKETGEDEFTVRQIPWGGGGISKLIATGVVGK